MSLQTCYRDISLTKNYEELLNSYRTYDRLWLSFRPATQKTYTRMFQDFMGFLVASGLSLGQVNTYILLAFLEYLHSHALTVTNISNYLAGIRVFFILYALPTDMFKDQGIQMFVKSLKMNTSSKCSCFLNRNASRHSHPDSKI